jgi:ribose 5-phosphate isomerase A
MVVGLGTGSTAVHAVRAIGRRLQNGELRGVIGIPTSEQTAIDARQWQIPLTSFDAHPQIDITIDGADEIDPHLDLIKGLGGALLREKIVAAASVRMIIVADETKLVDQLGTRAPVPVEVIPFARQLVTVFLRSLGAETLLRQKDGRVYRTDENNIILDCHFAGGVGDPTALARAIRFQPGVVEHGLFLNCAGDAIVAAADGIHHLRRP